MSFILFIDQYNDFKSLYWPLETSIPVKWSIFYELKFDFHLIENAKEQKVELSSNSVLVYLLRNKKVLSEVGFEPISGEPPNNNWEIAP